MPVSDYFSKFIVYYVEDAVFNGEQPSRRKYLQRYSAIEGCEYDTLQENLRFLTDVLEDYKEKKSEVSLKIVKYLVKHCYLPDSFVEDFLERLSSWEKSLATYSSYMRGRGGDIFNEMPGGKMLKTDNQQEEEEEDASDLFKGMEAIDLGLPSGTKWANMNVGATKPEDVGIHYAWGETTEKDDFGWNTYDYCNGDKNSCYDIGANICATRKDVAFFKSDGIWKLPALQQYKELCDYCTYQWTSLHGVYGGMFTSKINGNSVFFPAAGYRLNHVTNEKARKGFYWSGSRHPEEKNKAYHLGFREGRVGWGDYNYRLFGNSVRPVTF